jgi:hypothetical protein
VESLSIYLGLCCAVFLMIVFGVYRHSRSAGFAFRRFAVCIFGGLLLLLAALAVGIPMSLIGVGGPIAYALSEELLKFLIFQTVKIRLIAAYVVVCFSAFEVLIAKGVMLASSGQLASLPVTFRAILLFSALLLNPVIVHLTTVRAYVTFHRLWQAFLASAVIHSVYNIAEAYNTKGSEAPNGLLTAVLFLVSVLLLLVCKGTEAIETASELR